VQEKLSHVALASQQVLASQEARFPEHCVALPTFTGVPPVQEVNWSHVAFASQQAAAVHEAASPEHCTPLPLFTGVAPVQEKLSHVAGGAAGEAVIAAVLIFQGITPQNSAGATQFTCPLRPVVVRTWPACVHVPKLTTPPSKFDIITS
jgi:hypothetical protein